MNGLEVDERNGMPNQTWMARLSVGYQESMGHAGHVHHAGSGVCARGLELFPHVKGRSRRLTSVKGGDKYGENCVLQERQWWGNRVTMGLNVCNVGISFHFLFSNMRGVFREVAELVYISRQWLTFQHLLTVVSAISLQLTDDRGSRSPGKGHHRRLSCAFYAD